MKTAQETVLELIKSRTVLGRRADSSRPAGRRAKARAIGRRTAPSNRLEQSIKITPPKGAEFGKTEVFYLKVQAGDPARAIALTGAICRQLEKQFDDLRYQKYQGVIDELTKTVSLAQTDLDASTEALSAVEREAGPDLAELRILNETPSNESGLRRQAGEIETELRTYRGIGQFEPGTVEVAPGRAGRSGPAAGQPWPAARIAARAAAVERWAGRCRSCARPSCWATWPRITRPSSAARASEQEISQHLHDEISIAIKGLEVDLRTGQRAGRAGWKNNARTCRLG